MTAAVTTVVAGTPDFSTFTLELNGIQSQPLPYGATEAQGATEVKNLFGPLCPNEILSGIGTAYLSYA